MDPLTELIRFRSLVDSLNDAEFDLFITKLFNKFNKRQLIVTSLFHLFYAQNRNKKNNQNLTLVTDMIRNIIHTRNINKNKISLITSVTEDIADIQGHTGDAIKIHLCDLPRALIGECASYLHFNEYIQFQRSSRTIFFGCNNPISLRYINKTMIFKNYNYQNLSESSNRYKQLAKYSKAESIEIDVDKFLSMPSLHDIQISNNIKTLLITNSNALTLAAFLKTNSIKFENVTSLKLHNYQLLNLEFNHRDLVNTEYAKVFVDLLKRMVNLKFVELDINRSLLSDTVNVIIATLQEPENKHILHKIEGFCFYGSSARYVPLYNELLRNTSDRLMSLHVDGCVHSNKGYAKLEEFCVWRPTVLKLKNVISTAKLIKRVHLRFKGEEIGQDLFEQMVELFGGDDIEFISIKLDTELVKIGDAIIKAADKWNGKKRMKVVIHVTQKLEIVNKYFKEFTRKLEENVDDWMLIFRCIITENMLGYLNGNKGGVGEECTFRRWNKGCKINGYKEKWLYPCICNK